MDIKSILRTEHLILKLISMLKCQQFVCATKCSTENVAKGKKKFNVLRIREENSRYKQILILKKKKPIVLVFDSNVNLYYRVFNIFRLNICFFRAFVQSDVIPI